MARQAGDGKPEMAGTLVLGEHRIGVAWLGLAILALGVAVMTFSLWEFAGQGPWPILVIWPVGAVLALPLVMTRVVRVGPGTVEVERRLLGLAWTRRLPAARFRTVVVEGRYVASRYSAANSRTPEGLALGMLFWQRLEGRSGVSLPALGRNVDAEEALARRVGLLLALPCERRGYTRRADGLPAPARTSLGERL